jgi:hypothetical protein
MEADLTAVGPQQQLKAVLRSSARCGLPFAPFGREDLRAEHGNANSTRCWDRRAPNEPERERVHADEH